MRQTANEMRMLRCMCGVTKKDNLDQKLTSVKVASTEKKVTETLVEFLSYVNLHFHFTLMQKFKFW